MEASLAQSGLQTGAHEDLVKRMPPRAQYTHEDIVNLFLTRQPKQSGRKKTEAEIRKTASSVAKHYLNPNMEYTTQEIKSGLANAWRLKLGPED